MVVHFGVARLEPGWKTAVACLGTFDGVHVGHAELVRRAVERAREAESPAVVVTFDRHPAEVLAPDRTPPYLATLDQNFAQFSRLGVATCVVLPFDAAFTQVTAAGFMSLLTDRVHATEFVVGHDFTFGKGREADAAWLAARHRALVVPPVLVDGVRVSSTAVRAAVLEGRMVDATRLLGRPFALAGVVVGGKKLGRGLGYPTVNLATSGRMAVPADGVYAGTADTVLGEYAAAISVGVRPAVGGGARTVEAYLLDFPGTSLYGSAVELRVLERMRGEEDFPDLESLKKAIARDVEAVRGLVGRA